MQTFQVYTENALVKNVVNARFLLKYRLKECFVHFCGCQQAVKKAKEYLSKTHDIPLDTISSDMNKLRIESEIPDERLKKYAAYFGITVDELKNK